MSNNFDYFAMMYLNDWYWFDKRFFEKITSENQNDRISGIHDAAKYYKVTRNFVRINEKRRLETASSLLQFSDPITDENVVTTVTTLAKSFQEKYEKNAISAASKFLWLKVRSPVIIFDSRALKWLKTNGYPVPHGGGYGEYRKKWLAAFQEHDVQIQSACAGLPAVRKYTHAYKESEKAISKLCSSRWFRERVFDKYLWFNADER